MKKKKVIIAAVVLLLAVLMLDVTIAYFTSTSSVTNTFTIGSVSIQLTEPSWSANKAKNLTPGAEIAKDPKVTNTSATDNKVYTFISVQVPKVDDVELFTYTVNTGWTEISVDKTSSEDYNVHVYAYGTADTMTALDVDATTTTLFDKVVLTSDDTLLDQGDTLTMPIKAYGIQYDNLGSATTPSEIFALFKA